MKKKLSCALRCFVLLIFIFPFLTDSYILAEEQKQVTDIKELSLDDLLNVKITTAGKQEERANEVPASVIVITRADIEKYGYQTLGEVLGSIPGLYYTNDYLTQNLGVRGYWTVDSLRNMTILVNDVPQTDALLSANILEQLNLPVEAIDRIEVVRGPMSVIYGSGAFFGVINIKTNVVDEKNAVSRVSASLGSEKTYKLFARASGKTGDFEYAFNGSYFDTEGPDLPMDKMGGAKYAGRTTKGLLKSTEKFFNFSGKFKDFYFNSSYTEANQRVMFLAIPVSDNMIHIPYGLRLNFGYTKKFSEKIRAEAKLGYFSTGREIDYNILLNNLFGEQFQASKGYNAEFNLFIDPSANLNLTFGLNYQNIFNLSNRVNLPKLGYISNNRKLAEEDSIVTESLFAQINYKISDKFKVVAGARLDKTPAYNLQNNVVNGDPTSPNFGTYTATLVDISYTKTEFIPRLALLYSPNSRNVIKLLYGEALNRPSPFQHMAMLLNPALPLLEPEKIRTFELNYVGQISKRFSLSMSLFNNSLNKLIFRTIGVVGNQVTQYYSNVGKMQTNGAELIINTIPFNNFNLELSATYQDTKDKRAGFENITPGYSPKFLGYLKTSYFITNDISLALTGNYVDKMEAYWDASLKNPDNSYGRRIGNPVNAYFLLGANFRARNLFGTGLFLNISGTNLLDKEIFYPTTSNNSGFFPYGTMGKGLAFLVTLGWNF
ncbi:MAG: TonB-dependent receptor plug domain-containing protein [Candidatus Omnitrophota bacterium]